MNVVDFNSFCARATGSFAEFACDAPRSKIYNNGQCLADYIYSWVKSGRGARVCGRDSTKLMVATSMIANYWCGFPPVVGSHVTRIFSGSPHDVHHPLLDPNIFP